jgi:hypothetical protein
MTNYYIQAVVHPTIPRHLVDARTQALLESAGFTFEASGQDWYLYVEEGLGACWDEETGERIEYEQVLQDVLKRAGDELDYLTIEAALTCDKMRPDGFGGFAVFITAEEIDDWSTNGWLMRKMSEHCQG